MNASTQQEKAAVAQAHLARIEAILARPRPDVLTLATDISRSDLQLADVERILVSLMTGYRRGVGRENTDSRLLDLIDLAAEHCSAVLEGPATEPAEYSDEMLADDRRAGLV